MKTGVVGLGAMGRGMAACLYRAGFLQCVWNRSEARATDFARKYPVVVAAAIDELAAGCDVILLCVSADDDVRQVVEQLLPSIRPGAVVVDTSTVSRQTAQQAARRLAERGAHFLDAPVSGGVEGARQGRLAMMVGGSAEVLQRVLPVLQAISANIEHMGDVGSGQATKAANQIMAAGINQAVTEALAFAEAEQLPMDKVIQVLSSGAAANWFLQHRGKTMVEGSFDAGFRLALHHKDLEICKAMAARFDVQLPLIEMTLIHYRRLMAEGFGDEDISSLFRHKRRMFQAGEEPPY